MKFGSDQQELHVCDMFLRLYDSLTKIRTYLTLKLNVDFLQIFEKTY